MPTPERPRPTLHHRRILAWYGEHRRELRWRRTTDPYEILVSEVMLQQTQVARVREKLPLFLRAYPTLRRLARATNAEVIRAWRGMGYNNRALRLRDAARALLRDHGGTIPADAEALRRLPGIGRYTAHAVLCFAHRCEVPVVDVNIRRVLSRMFAPQPSLESALGERAAWELAAAVLPTPCHDWNQALMDLGATICTARRPACAACPVRTLCASADALEHARPGPPRTGAKAEPAHAGVPRRIWRGRAVEALRSLDGAATIRLEELGALIKDDFRPRDRAWLSGLIRQLQDDGLVDVRRSGATIRVRLAS